MASGWRDLLEEMNRQSAAKAPDPAAVWRTFEELSAASPRSDLLGIALQLGPTLSPEQRGLLAGMVSALLDPIEWPGEWEQARRPLVEALEELWKQADPEASDSLAAALVLEQDELLLVSYGTLTVALRLLQAPCPRHEIGYTANLCYIGTAGCFAALVQKLEHLPPAVDRESIQLAKTRFEVAFQAYARAARAMNAACGIVLFDGLEMRLGGT